MLKKKGILIHAYDKNGLYWMKINNFSYFFFFLMLSGAGDSTFLNCVEWLSLSRGAAGSWTLGRVRRIVSQGGFNYIRCFSRMRISAHFSTCWLLSFPPLCMPFHIQINFKFAKFHMR